MRSGPDGCESINRREDGGDKHVEQKRRASAPPVGQPAETGVTQEGSELHGENPGAGLHHVESGSALRSGRGEKSGKPGVESPIREKHGCGERGGEPGSLGQRTAEEIEPGTRGRFGSPQWRLFHLALDPDGEQRGKQSGEEQDAPSEARQYEGGGGGREHVAERPAGLHQRDGFGTMARRPTLSHQHGAGRPFATESESDNASPEDERRKAGGGGGSAGADGVDQDGEDQGAAPPDAIGEKSSADAAECGRDQSGGADQTGDGGRPMKFGAQRLDHEDVEENVVGIENEAGHGRPKSEAALLGDPGERAWPDNRRGGLCGVRQGRFKISRAAGTLGEWPWRFRPSTLRGATNHWWR